MVKKLFLVRLACFSLFVSVLLTCGCGGSGAGNTGKTYPLAAQTRALQPGDTWTYDNHETVRIAASMGSDTSSLTRISDVLLSGEVAGRYYTVDNFSQNAAGDIFYSMRQGTPFSRLLPNDPLRETQTLPTPQRVLFGQWAQSQELHYDLNYDNDAAGPAGSESETLSIVGTEKITVALGTFETWKVQSTKNYPGSSEPQSITYWYAPQIGNYVRARIRESGHEYDVTLKSTSVPLGEPQPVP